MSYQGGVPIEGAGPGEPGACAVCRTCHAADEPCRLGTPAVRAGTLPIVGVEPVPSPSGPDSCDPLLGAAIGNFRIVRKLGHGGMGTVYLAEHATIGSRVAIKFLHPHLAQDRGLVERFFAEAKAANLVGHENIVSILDLNLLPPDRYYLMMEYLEGQPLSSMPLPMAPAVAVPILCQVCAALEAAHARGVVHRDLKPDNVFLLKRSGEHFVKLVDFGIAKLAGAGESGPGLTMAGLAIGTPEYMAPEQWVGGAIDGRTDLYAVGVMAYALLAGRLPFVEPVPFAYYQAHREKPVEPPRRLNPVLPAALEQLLLRALAKRPEDRFQSAGELRTALQAALAAPAATTSTTATAGTTATTATTGTNAVAARASAAPLPTPKPPARALVLLVSAAGAPLRELRAVELSRGGGMFLAEPPFPALFTRVQVSLPGASVSCAAEVVRHVDASQARAWATEPGFAVQFVAMSAPFREALEAALAGRQPTPPGVRTGASGDAEADRLLAPFLKRPGPDPYLLLELELDAECSEVRSRVRQLRSGLEAVGQKGLSPARRERVESALARLDEALRCVGEPAQRAAYDARRANFRGVARCISAGLTPTQLETLRKQFLAEKPRAAATAQLQLAAANAFLAERDTAAALGALERALSEDPLRLESHQRYWSLKRQLAQSAATGSNR